MSWSRMRMVERHATVLLALTGFVTSATRATAATIFSDAFAYSTGTLAGNNGGFGWGGSWSGGASVVTGPLPGTYGASVRMSDDATITFRPMTTAVFTGSATT